MASRSYIFRVWFELLLIKWFQSFTLSICLNILAILLYCPAIVYWMSIALKDVTKMSSEKEKLICRLRWTFDSFATEKWKKKKKRKKCRLSNHFISSLSSKKCYTNFSSSSWKRRKRPPPSPPPPPTTLHVKPPANVLSQWKKKIPHLLEEQSAAEGQLWPKGNNIHTVCPHWYGHISWKTETNETSSRAFSIWLRSHVTWAEHTKRCHHTEMFT